MKQTTINNKLKLAYGDDNIIRLEFLNESEPDISTAIEATNFIDKLIIKKHKQATLIDARHLSFLACKVRKQFCSHLKGNIVAVALVVESATQNMFADLFVRFTNRHTPTRIFRHPQEATEWLKLEMKRT